MKRKYFVAQHGLTLIELVIGMALILCLLSGIVGLFSGSLKVWLFGKQQSHLNQTARIAMDSIVKEIRYAQQITLKNTSSLVVRKVNGEIRTLQLGEGLHSKTLYVIIDKTKAIPPGGISSSPITENLVTNLQFVQRGNSKAVLVTLEVINESTGERRLLRTACYPLNLQ
jgi:prepilin-type N-terminal cleavage/methylation domain-containing protein